MRTRISLITLVGLSALGTVLGLPARSVNLCPNGSFEEPQKTNMLAGMDSTTREFYDGTIQSPFEDWVFGGRWEKGDYTVGDSSEAHSGNHSCLITCVKQGRGGIAAKPQSFKSGTILKVSFWLKARDAVGGRIFLNFEGSPGDGWASKELKTGTYEWTQFTRRVVVPGGQRGGPQTIAVFLYTTCEGSVRIDDFTIETVDTNAATDSLDESPERPRVPHPIAETADSAGYRVNVVSPLEKVFREDDYSAQTRAAVAVSAARNEYVSAQVVIETPWRAVTVKEIRLSDLTGPGGTVIPASALKWERVDYIRTTSTPPYYAERGLGWYPDPLMPAGEFTVEQRSRTPVWITLKTPKECPPGRYSGTITIVPDRLKPTVLPLNLTVWDFALTDQAHLRTLTWLGGGLLRQFYGYDWSPEGNREQDEAYRRYAELLLDHRLGPGGECATLAPGGQNGKYDFTSVDNTLQWVTAKGMNAFILGTAPNLGREHKTTYGPEFIRDFSGMIRAYSDHLRDKGWLDMAYVYVYDEAPRSAWPEVKKIDRAIKDAAPDLRILQCLNEPEGVKELTGFADVFDVYVAQYHKTGVADSQAKGAEAWLAICCYPMEHPNFFIEYPLVDLRVTPWLCWKYHARGFEYWSPNSWGINSSRKGEKWPAASWTANAFGRYNGDGYLVYPGPNGVPYSSIRLETLRNGFEDYEYFWTLDELARRAEKAGKTGPLLDEAHRLLTLDDIVKASGSFSTNTDAYPEYRQRVAASIVALKRLVETN